MIGYFLPNFHTQRAFVLLNGRFGDSPLLPAMKGAQIALWTDDPLEPKRPEDGEWGVGHEPPQGRTGGRGLGPYEQAIFRWVVLYTLYWSVRTNLPVSHSILEGDL